MRWVFAMVVLLHGLIHAMGFVKAFGLAQLPQLTLPISRAAGVVWLLAGLLCVATAIAFFAWPRGWWAIGALAVVVSQIVIVTAWGDAKVGTIANVILLAGVAYGFATHGPTSFQAELERETVDGIARGTDAPIVTEADLARLPEPVQRYVRATGFVGRPRVRNYRVRFRGRIRSAADAGWMPFVADQQSFVDRRTRLFLMRATMFGVPVQAFHRLAGGAATMRVRVAGVYPMVDASGPVMNRSEAVTLFNDMCILAPGTLIEPSIAWEAIDARSARAHFTLGESTITATLFFDEHGLLTDFASDDRSRSSPDGRSFTQLRFTTPIREYRSYGAFRLASRGDARWHPPEGEFAYGEFEMIDVAFNVREPF